MNPPDIKSDNFERFVWLAEIKSAHGLWVAHDAPEGRDLEPYVRVNDLSDSGLPEDIVKRYIESGQVVSELPSIIRSEIVRFTKPDLYTPEQLEAGKSAFNTYLNALYVSAVPSTVLLWDQLPDKVRFAWVEVAIS
jgi:hypothetical protein